MNPDTDIYFMRQALAEAAKAETADEVPTGCVIVWQNRIIGRAHNQTELLKDPTAHAEMIAITQAASARDDWRLNGCTLYVTKEPCAMCAGAIVLARPDRVVWGLSDPNRGGISQFNLLNHPNLNHRPVLCPGVLEEECKAAFQAFFRRKRAKPAGEE